MTRESKMAVPSSSNRVGILPSGFCVASVSAGSVTSAWHSTISLSSLRSRIAMRTLRTKGDDEVDRKIIGIDLELRFRSSQAIGVTSDANFGIKGALANNDF